MSGKFESRHELVGLIDEVTRISGRLKSLFAEARRTVELNDSEMMVLNSVVEAERLPTVSQIGRSLGQPRQIVQRAANSLLDAGLLETRPNPDHKRAPLLVASVSGTKLKRKADACADAVAAGLTKGLNLSDVAKATKRLRKVRQHLEAQLRIKEA